MRGTLVRCPQWRLGMLPAISGGGIQRDVLERACLGRETAGPQNPVIDMYLLSLCPQANNVISFSFKMSDLSVCVLEAWVSVRWWEPTVRRRAQVRFAGDGWYVMGVRGGQVVIVVLLRPQVSSRKIKLFLCPLCTIAFCSHHVTDFLPSLGDCLLWGDQLGLSASLKLTVWTFNLPNSELKSLGFQSIRLQVFHYRGFDEYSD